MYYVHDLEAWASAPVWTLDWVWLIEAVSITSRLPFPAPTSKKEKEKKETVSDVFQTRGKNLVPF